MALKVAWEMRCLAQHFSTKCTTVASLGRNCRARTRGLSDGPRRKPRLLRGGLVTVQTFAGQASRAAVRTQSALMRGGQRRFERHSLPAPAIAPAAWGLFRIAA
ncbi:hypothetical protein GBAR_LOCUS2243 [Geodia barretti]|uniref:Uncharacterized protein n=1 Tax=Geodia barretti TaxID=519541 RepID=A0AA35QZ21_GEOBA|nr:hypothetical protein GBAR_LOCUS2243 [Geodia barretti]